MEPFEIETPRLLLRPFRLSDAGDVYEYARDEEWSRFLPVPRPYEPHHADEFVATVILRNWTTWPTWAIEAPGERGSVGGINLRIDAANEVAEMGYSIARSHWNKGYMTEAAGAVVAKAFARWCVAKVAAMADADNSGSWRVMEKIGMRREAHLRSNLITHGERRDEVRYGILRDEFEGSRHRDR